MRFAITFSDPTQEASAQALAHTLALPIITKETMTTYDYVLVLTSEYLGIQAGSDQTKPFFIDFSAKKLQYRFDQATVRKELLARAIGFKPAMHARIVDLTAGLGRDSLLLATLGFEVVMVERSPIIHALLADALRRAAHHPSLAPIVSRLSLLHADAKTWLSKTAAFDVVYLDPMFPKREKAAKVKKEMVLLQQVVGEDPDSPALFELALTCAKNRVVIKRPRLAKNPWTLKPTFVLVGKSSRFEAYVKPT